MIFREISKMCQQFPDDAKQILQCSHDQSVYSLGTKTMIVFSLICLSKKNKEWTRWYNRAYPRSVNIRSSSRYTDECFRRLDIPPSNNRRPVNKEKIPYDFCVIHSLHEQEWVTCCLRPELEEGPEKFKGTKILDRNQIYFVLQIIDKNATINFFFLL